MRPQTGRPVRRQTRGRGGAASGSGALGAGEEVPRQRRTGQGHLQASWAAPRGSLSAAPRRRAPAIWRRREPRHLRVCPSPGREPALARGGGRAHGGLREGALGGRWTAAQEALVSLQRWQWTPSSGGAFFSELRLAWARLLLGKVGGAWRGEDPERRRTRTDELSLPPLSRAQPRRVTPSPPVPGPARRPCAPPPASPPSPLPASLSSLLLPLQPG